MITYAFFAKMSQASPLRQSLSYFLVSSCRWVSLAEYLLVLRALFSFVVADGQMYYGYCSNCLYPAMGDN
jgi:hypothetical protein